jgi:hypothetical protein
MLAVFGPVVLGAGVRSVAAATAVSASELRACAAIESNADRLACYDRLAGRSTAPAAAPAPGSPSPAAAAPAAAAPAATASAAAATAAATAAAARASPPAPATTAETFGNYAAEHPKPAPLPAASSLEAKIASVGNSASGHMTVLLDGGAMWELDSADPLLAAGQRVTITRAALGSYIMQTPSHRTHRVRRLH